MSAFKANLINALVLIALSGWGYLSSDAPSLTALIPAMFGLLLLICSPGVKSEHKVVSHIAVLLTLLLLVALFMPLKGAIARGDSLAMLRVGLMMLSSAVAMGCFIASFIAVRKARQAAQQSAE
ncbi:MAG: hypothetical protein HRU21_05510 [Pseudomonadales bacterium]|nr:hypothetical protein [Pseudomonadales bacterium]